MDVILVGIGVTSVLFSKGTERDSALSFLTGLSHLCLGLCQKVVPKTLLAAPFRKEAPHPWAYAQRGFITPVIIVFLAAEPADKDSILFFHTSFSFAHAYHAPQLVRIFARQKWKKGKPMRFPSLSLRILSELLGDLGEEVVRFDGVVDKRLPALVMDALSEVSAV
jgi:hypothetical protein